MYVIAVFPSYFAFVIRDDIPSYTLYLRDPARRSTPVLGTGIVHVRTYSCTADRVGSHSDEHEAGMT